MDGLGVARPGERALPLFPGGRRRKRGQTRCAWPGRLTLDLDEKGGRFSQEWTVEPAQAPDAAERVPLPGDGRRWPLDLTVDGKLGRGVPTTRTRRRSGSGRDATRSPASSAGTPCRNLSRAAGGRAGGLDGARRGGAVPERGDAGEVFLQRAPVAPTEAESLKIVVQRRVIDEVPLLLVTRIELAVSGKAREMLLGRALPDRFLPLSLDGALPARLEPDGRLRVQVRPGTWTLGLTRATRGRPGAHSSAVRRRTVGRRRGLGV